MCLPAIPSPSPSPSVPVPIPIPNPNPTRQVQPTNPSTPSVRTNTIPGPQYQPGRYTFTPITRCQLLCSALLSLVLPESTLTTSNQQRHTTARRPRSRPSFRLGPDARTNVQPLRPSPSALRFVSTAFSYASILRPRVCSPSSFRQHPTQNIRRQYDDTVQHISASSSATRAHDHGAASILPCQPALWRLYSHPATHYDSTTGQPLIRDSDNSLLVFLLCPPTSSPPTNQHPDSIAAASARRHNAAIDPRCVFSLESAVPHARSPTAKTHARCQRCDSLAPDPAEPASSSRRCRRPQGWAACHSQPGVVTGAVSRPRTHRRPPVSCPIPSHPIPSIPTGHAQSLSPSGIVTLSASWLGPVSPLPVSPHHFLPILNTIARDPDTTLHCTPPHSSPPSLSSLPLSDVPLRTYLHWRCPPLAHQRMSGVSRY